MKQLTIGSLIGAAVLCLPAPAAAQTLDPMLALKQLPELRFPDKPVEGAPTRVEPEMAVYKPAGLGPFPAVVILHGCAGIFAHVGVWTNLFHKAGYAVLVQDSLTQRNVRSNCSLPFAISFINGTLDTYQALEHLAKQPYVDKDRIGLLGFSWGAGVALLAARKDLAERLPRGSKELRFRALAAMYPLCFVPRFQTPRGPMDLEWLSMDATDRSLLVLMGEDDTEAPPKLCVPRLETLKSKGVNVSWHVYPGTAHAWDNQAAHGHSVRTLFGGTHTYQYNPAVTQESYKRVLDFFGQELRAAKP